MKNLSEKNIQGFQVDAVKMALSATQNVAKKIGQSEIEL